MRPLPRLEALRRIKVTPALIISLVALAVASGGSAYAVNTVRGSDVVDGSLTSRDIATGSLNGSDIRTGSIFSSDIKNGALLAEDFAPGVIKPGPAGPRGPAGADGEDGADGQDGADGADGAGTRWVLVNADGTIAAQSGGFTVNAAYPTLPNTAPEGAPDNSLRAAGNVYLNAGVDLTNKGLVVSIALQNAQDQNNDGVMSGRAPGPDANPEFSGEITATKCAIPNVVSCAPPGANDATDGDFVVSPRLSDGQVTTSTNRKRFYVIITS